MKKQNIFLIILSLFSIYFSSFLYVVRLYNYDNFFTILGTLMILFITIVNDVSRLCKNKKLAHITSNLHILGITSFLLILPHTGETGAITRQIESNSIDYDITYLLVPTIAFIVLFIMTVTSIQGFQPKWWKKFHRIIWISLPFIALHLWLVEYKFISILYILPMVLPLLGLALDKINNSIYLKQLIMLLIGMFLMYLTLYQTMIMQNLLKFSFLIVPSLLLLTSIFYIENTKLRLTLLKYLIVLIVLIFLFISLFRK